MGEEEWTVKKESLGFDQWLFEDMDRDVRRGSLTLFYQSELKPVWSLIERNTLVNKESVVTEAILALVTVHNDLFT